MSWKKEVVTRAFRKKFGLKNMILDNCCNFECITFSKRDGSLVVSFVYPNVTAEGISLRYMVIKRYSSEKDKVEELTLFDDNIQMESYHWPVTELNVDFDSSVHLFDYEWRDIEENLKFMHELDMDKSINGFEILCRALSNLNIPLSTVNSCKVAGLEIKDRKIYSYIEAHKDYSLNYAWFRTTYKSGATEVEINKEGDSYQISFSGDRDLVMKCNPMEAVNDAESKILEIRKFASEFDSLQKRGESCDELVKERLKGVH